MYRFFMITVALDLDECLFPFVRSLDRYVHRNYGIKPDPKCTAYDFSKRYHVPAQHMKYVVRDFYRSHESKCAEPIDGSVASVYCLKRRYRLICVTGRQPYSKSSTFSFLDAHFPHAFDSVRFTNSYSLEGSSVTKKSVCEEEKAPILIDDNPHYLHECKDHLLTIAFVGHPIYSWAYEEDDIPSFSQWKDCPLLSRVA